MKPKILLLDRDPQFRELMLEILGEKLEMYECDNMESAFVLADRIDFDLLICENDFSTDAFGNFIRKFRNLNPRAYFAVITSIASIENAQDALRLGAIDYLKKPFSIEELAQVIDKFFALMHVKSNDLDFVSFQTEEKRSFVLETNFYLINPFINFLLESIKKFTDQNRKTLFSIRISVYEMLVNAMEHGNLEISYSEKQKFLEEQPDYQKFLQKRCNEAQFKDRKIKVTFEYSGDVLSFSFEDEGKGFDFGVLPSPKAKENLSALNGRGIFITQVNMDEVEYNEKGNKVTIRKKLNMVN